jgi:TPR repeat protein
MFQGHVDFETAAPVGADTIQNILFERGLYWASGRAGLVDLVAAHKWFNLAALKGHAEGTAMRREVAALMSEAEIVVAQRDARAWMTVH